MELNNEERTELQKFKNEGWNYIFCTDEGYIAVSNIKPYRNSSWWDVDLDQDGEIQELWDCELFNFISYTDKEPYSIKDLLNN